MPLLFLASLFAAVFLLPAALARANARPRRLDRVVRARLVQPGRGQGLLVYALGHVPPLVVGIAMLTQPALSALLGWLYYDEASPCSTGPARRRSSLRWCWSACATPAQATN